MQRASNTTHTPTTPSSEPSLKRRKTEHTHTPDSSVPTTPASEPKAFVDRAEVRAALKAESAYEALVAARRAELGFGSNDYETQWVLDVTVPARNGMAEDEDSSDEEEEEDEDEDIWAESNGRQTYGSYKRGKKTGTSSAATTPARNSTGIDLISDDDEDDEDEDGDDDEQSSDDSEDERPTPSQLKKRKVKSMDLTDAAAMSALDHVDLSRSSYARSKGAPSRPSQRDRDRGSHPKDRRGEKHPKGGKNKNQNVRKNRKR